MPREATNNAVLSLVAQSRSYGYQLEQEFSGWPLGGPLVPRGRGIFKSLEDLRRDGLIEPAVPNAEHVAARSGRDRRWYQATEDGRRQVSEWMDSEPESIDELWLRIGSARREDIPALVRWIKHAERACLDRLEDLGVPDLEQLVAGGAPWRLVSRAVVHAVEISQVAERSRLLREVRRSLVQAMQDDASTS